MQNNIFFIQKLDLYSPERVQMMDNSIGHDTGERILNKFRDIGLRKVNQMASRFYRYYMLISIDLRTKWPNIQAVICFSLS